MPSLPEGWTETEVVADVVVIGGVRIARAAVAVRGPSGVEVTGSAAEADEAPAARARYELFERVAAAASMPTDPGPPSPWRAARSNGVALHTTREGARECARWELGERHLVLRSWYGETTPRHLSEVEARPARELLVGLEREGYDITMWQLPDDGSSRASEGLAVVVVVAFPTRPDRPLAMGFSGRPSAREAARHAAREALQGAAFLWDEPLPSAPPAPHPTPTFHLDHYQYPPHHAHLRRWLAGGHAVHRGVQRRVGPEQAEVAYEDLGGPWLGPLHVVRARCASAMPLVFGTPPWGNLVVPSLRVHPVA